MRIGSLFSGYGGLELGVQAALGGTVAWRSEVEPAAVRILKHHWPDTPNLGDITTVDWTAVEPVDVLTGGFPCQDLSHAGIRKGLRPGTRSGLWTHMAYAIDALRPQLVVIENVRGLLSAEAHSDMERDCWCVGDGREAPLRALGAVLGDLADLGMDAEWVGVRASDVGAPHQRFRVFVVAYPGGEAGLIWAGLRAGEPGGLGWGRPDDDGREDAADATVGGREAGEVQHRGQPDVGARRDLAADPGGAGREGLGQAGPGWRGRAADRDRGPGVALLPTPRSTDGPKGGPGQVNGRGIPDSLPAISALIGARNGDTAEAACGCTAWGGYAPAVHRWERVLGRPAPAPTDGRRLNPAAVEFMMGLPAGHVTDVPGLSYAAQLKALGNGVVPQQAAHALHVLGVAA